MKIAYVFRSQKSNLLLLLSLILFLVPGNLGSFFNGLPLSSAHELVVLLIIASSAISLNVRDMFKKVFLKFPQMGYALLALTAIAIPVKFAHSDDVSNGHFDACYHSYVRSDDMEVPECEPFFSQKFEGGRSRFDREIDFYGLDYPLRNINVVGSNWNLSFVNNEQFIGRYGNYEQVRHPFRANWRGKISVGIENGFIPITYVGFGSININSNTTKLPFHTGVPRTEWVPVSKGVHSIEVDYSFTSLQMKPVNGVDYSSYGYYATLKVGSVQKNESSIVDTLLGWAVDPETFQRLNEIVVIEDGRVVQRIIPTTYRADVASYLGVEFENPYIGFSISDAEPKSNSRIVGIGVDGKRHVLLSGDGERWIEGTAVAKDKMWFSIDYSFDSGLRFEALEPISIGGASRATIHAIDGLLTLYALASLLALLFALRRSWKAGLILSLGVIAHYVFLDPLVGWGSDTVEGSELLYVSTSVVILALTYTIFFEQRSFVPIGILSAVYLAVDRVRAVNPGMRYDFFLPVYGESPASSLGSIFFRPAATDWLIHAANTRSSLFRGFLFGNEPIFYLQPGYRYFAPAMQFLFGDGDVRLSILVMFCVIASLVLLIGQFVKNANRLDSKIIIGALVTSGILITTSWVFVYFLLVQTTEIPTWPFMLFAAFAIVRFRNSFAGVVLPGMMLGLAVCMRPNQIIGHVFLLMALSFLVTQGLPSRIQIFFQFKRFIVMGLFSSLPLMHNLYYGKEFVLFSTSRAGDSFDWSAAKDHVSQYVYIFSRPLRSLDLTSNGIMGLPGENGFSIPLWIGLMMLFAIWLLMGVQSLRSNSRTFSIWVVFLSPVVYLLPIIPYHAYFPRHAVAFWFAVIISAASLKTWSKLEPSCKDKTF
jgi:hypothetical protein